MKHYFTRTHDKLLARLPKPTQKKAAQIYEAMKADSENRQHHRKKIHNKKNCWSAEIGRNYRALGQEDKTGIVWSWIGSHEAYNKKLK